MLSFIIEYSILSKGEILGLLILNFGINQCRSKI